MADVDGSLYDLDPVASATNGVFIDGSAYDLVSEPVTTIFTFKMRGRDDGRTPGSDYITWTNVGMIPDFAGVGFAGGSPAPIGSLIAGSVVEVSRWV